VNFPLDSLQVARLPPSLLASLPPPPSPMNFAATTAVPRTNACENSKVLKSKLPDFRLTGFGLPRAFPATPFSGTFDPRWELNKTDQGRSPSFHAAAAFTKQRRRVAESPKSNAKPARASRRRCRAALPLALPLPLLRPSSPCGRDFP